MTDKNINPVASVIIPTYNRSNLINEAIDSALRQTFCNFELLVVDDGSTDSTAEVVNKYKDSRIKYFYKQNGGLASARNFGISKATGQYIVFLDDDDLLFDNFLQTMIEKLEQNNQYGLAYCRYLNVFPDGREEISFGPERFFSGFLTQYYFKKIPDILPSATLFRKSVFEEQLFDEYLRVYEDQDFFLRLSKNVKFLCVQEILVKRRKTQDSLSERVEIIYLPILVYERFYYHFNDRDIVPAMTAKRKLSQFYRRVAKKHLQMGHRKAAVSFLKKAIRYCPYNLKYYKDLAKALLLNKDKDGLPDWRMPEPLPPYITVDGKKTCKFV